MLPLRNINRVPKMKPNTLRTLEQDRRSNSTLTFTIFPTQARSTFHCFVKTNISTLVMSYRKCSTNTCMLQSTICCLLKYKFYKNFTICTYFPMLYRPEYIKVANASRLFSPKYRDKILGPSSLLFSGYSPGNSARTSC